MRQIHHARSHHPLVAILAAGGMILLGACWARTTTPVIPAPAAPPPAETAWRPLAAPTLLPGPPAPAPSTADWTFVVHSRNDGPQISFAGSLLSAGSPITCPSPDWKTVFFKMSRDAVAITRKPGGLDIASDPAAQGGFTLEGMQLETTGPLTMRMAVDGQLNVDGPAKIEYIPLCIPASIMEGAEIETAEGQRLPIGEANADMQQPTARLVLRTRCGRIVLNVVEGAGLSVLDRRVKPYHQRRSFLIMAGPFGDQPALAKGGRFRHVLEVSLPDGFRTSPDLATVAPAAAAVALPAQAAEVPAPAMELCPQPRSVAYAAGSIPLPAEVVISDDGLGETGRIAAILAETLASAGTPRQVRAGTDGWIRLRRIAMPVPGRWDYHRLRIGADGVEVEAVSPAAASYALGTLAQLVADGAVRRATVEDWSDLRYRGLHVIACDADALRVQTSVIRRIMVPLRLNQILLECCYVRWPSQPGIHHAKGMPYEDFKALATLAEEHLIAPIPCLNTYGHSEWLFHNKQNLDIAEDPVTPYAYDVSNPRTYEVIRSILDDLRAAVPRAPWIHVGHDEVTMRGRYPNRPANLGRPLGELLAKDLAFYREWAAANGTALMLWNDYLDGGSHPIASRDSLQTCIAGLDPSTVVAMWDYGAKEDYSRCDPFLSRQVTVFGATGEEDVANITTFARYAQRKGLPGMMHTTWTGYIGSVEAIYRWPRKLWPYIQAGVSFWNAAAPVIDRQEPSRATAMYDRMVGDLFPEVRRIAAGDRIQPIDLGTIANRSLGPDSFAAGMLRTPLGGCYVLPGGPAGASGVIINRGGSLRIPVGRSARGLSLLWACLSTDPEVRTVGTLAITGAQPATAPIIMLRHIGNLHTSQLTITDVPTGILQSRTDHEHNFSIARQVFPPMGRQVLWQYDQDLGGRQVEAVTITAGPTTDLLLTGLSIVE